MSRVGARSIIKTGIAACSPSFPNSLPLGETDPAAAGPVRAMEWVLGEDCLPRRSAAKVAGEGMTKAAAWDVTLDELILRQSATQRT